MEDMLLIKDFLDSMAYGIVFVDRETNEIAHFVGFEVEPQFEDMQEAETEALEDDDIELPQAYDIRLATISELERFKSLVIQTVNKDLN